MSVRAQFLKLWGILVCISSSNTHCCFMRGQVPCKSYADVVCRPEMPMSQVPAFEAGMDEIDLIKSFCHYS